MTHIDHQPTNVSAGSPGNFPAREGQCDCACQEAGSVLSTWLHVTDRCNLRCSYCYLPHEPRDLSLEVGRGCIESAFRSAVSHNYKALKIKYAGGEPLLRFPLLARFHEHARRLASKHGLQLDAVILSNGTLLTPEMAAKIKEAGLRLMISLDGIGPNHDCHRSEPNGRGTFASAANAVGLACSAGLLPDICITLSSRNARGLPEMVSWLLDQGLPFSLNFYRINKCSLDRPGLELDDSLIIASLREAFAVIEKRPPKYNLLSSLLDRTNLAYPHTYPCAAGHDYLVFDTRGNVAKCQMDMDCPVTDYRAPDPLEWVRTSNLGLVNPPVQDKEDCRDCPWQFYCAGGCPLQAHLVQGHYHGRSPSCRIYKALLPEVLRLEQIRTRSTLEPSVISR